MRLAISLLPSGSRAGHRTLAACALSALVLVGLTSSDAIADTAPPRAENALAGLAGMASTLTLERASLSAFSETRNFRRVARVPALPAQALRADDLDGQGVRARAALDAVGAEDAAATAAIDGAHGRAAKALFSMDIGGTVDLGQIDQIEIGERSDEWYCLAEALYFEARGESLVGQVAVAEVILNRVDSPRYPDTVCGVVSEGAKNRNACQFSYKCDGKSDEPGRASIFEKVGKIAYVMLNGKPRILTGRATHYHTTQVSPRWASRLVKTARIGEHLFYRPAVRLSLN